MLSNNYFCNLELLQLLCSCADEKTSKTQLGCCWNAAKVITRPVTKSLHGVIPQRKLFNDLIGRICLIYFPQRDVKVMISIFKANLVYLAFYLLLKLYWWT